MECGKSCLRLSQNLHPLLCMSSPSSGSFESLGTMGATGRKALRGLCQWPLPAQNLLQRLQGCLSCSPGHISPYPDTCPLSWLGVWFCSPNLESLKLGEVRHLQRTAICGVEDAGRIPFLQVKRCSKISLFSTAGCHLPKGPGCSGEQEHGSSEIIMVLYRIICSRNGLLLG